MIIFEQKFVSLIISLTLAFVSLLLESELFISIVFLFRLLIRWNFNRKESNLLIFEAFVIGFIKLMLYGVFESHY